MSVLIKGLTKEKVESCFRFAKDGWCIFDVPEIIEVPPHGRLIDADALEVHDGWLRDSKYFSQDSGHTHITFVYSNDIMDAPTIIPASEKEE